MKALLVAGLMAAAGALRGRGRGSMAIPRVRSLRGAVLEGAALRRRDMAGFDLSEANLSEAILKEANLSGAMLSDATYNETTRFPDSFAPEGRGMARSYE